MALAIAAFWLCSARAEAQPNAPKAHLPRDAKDAETVDRAMALIRQHQFPQARELLLAAAEGGAAESQALLGQMYNAGWGVPVDYKEAYKWWSLASAAGSNDALWGLGLLYDDGKGVARDSRKAVLLWKQASEAGNIKATVNLAFMFEEGRGTERNLAECARLFKVAGEAGEPAAQLNYGLKLIYGEGVERNPVLGCAWLAVATESSRYLGSQLAEKITQQRAQAWADLSPVDQERAEKAKEEIQARIKSARPSSKE
jgi:TPR repeat protein